MSAFFTAAVAALALSGGASAQVFGNGTLTTSSGLLGTGTAVSTSSTSIGGGVTASANMTSSVPTSTYGINSTASSTSSAAPTASDPTFCPRLNGEIYIGPLDVSFSISCDMNFIGVLIDITLAKRQSSNVTSLQDCLNVCAALDQCVATAYDTNNPSCSFYSSLDSAFSANGFEFAEVTDRGSNTTTTSSPAGATGTGALSSSATEGAPYPTGNNGTTAVGTGVSTTPSSTRSSVPTSSSTSDLFCPELNAQVFLDASGVEFIIECATNHFGIIIDIDITFSKRQAAAGATSLGDCLTLCSANDACVGTAYNTVEGTCTLYSSVGAAYNDPDVEFAVRVAPATTVTPGQTLTSTIYSSVVQTISSCAPTVTDCPLAGGISVVTEVIPVASTEYICPTATTIPGAVIACTSCPYAAVTATIYSQVVSTIYSCAPGVPCPATAGAYAYTTTCPAGYTLTTGGSTTVLSSASVITTTAPAGSSVVTTVASVATTVVNYPVPTNSGGAQATAASSVITTISKTSAKTTSKSTKTTSSGLAVYTGAATQLNAGAAAGAIVAGLAFML